MILQALSDLYERLKDDPNYDLPKPGFSPQKIAFKVVLKPDGTLYEIQDARKTNEGGRKVPTVIQCYGSGKRSGKTPKPNLLWDKQSYVLGLAEDGDDEKTKAQFASFKEFHLNLESEINHPWFSAVCCFLNEWSPERSHEWPFLEDLGPGFGVFQILGESRLVHEHTEIDSWLSERSQIGDDQSDIVIGQCLVSGEYGPIARLHCDIKGIAPPKGAQGKNAPFVSFQKNTPYESYGLTQGFNAPVSETIAMRYGTVLNELLAHKRHRIRIGDATCVFWTDRPSVAEDIFSAVLGQGIQVGVEIKGQDEGIRMKLENFLKALRQGREAYAELEDDPEAVNFYLLGLAPNAARISVRFFYRSTLGELLDHLRLHHAHIQVIKRYENDPEFPSIKRILSELVRNPKKDDPPPLISGALTRAVLEGTRYPEVIYTSILRRIHMERNMTYLKAALIKAVLIRNHQQKVSVMLDLENTDPAYRLGRLFAVLEKIEEEGYHEQTGGNKKNTIRGTYFSSACATPAAVFPRIEKLSVHHSRHLKPGRRVQFDKLIQEIKWTLTPDGGNPNTLGLKEQGLFSLGYYHQRQDLFTAKPKEPESNSTNEPQTELNLEGAS